jgi:hypothetical protein
VRRHRPPSATPATRSQQERHPVCPARAKKRSSCSDRLGRRSGPTSREGRPSPASINTFPTAPPSTAACASAARFEREHMQRQASFLAPRGSAPSATAAEDVLHVGVSFGLARNTVYASFPGRSTSRCGSFTADPGTIGQARCLARAPWHEDVRQAGPFGVRERSC